MIGEMRDAETKQLYNINGTVKFVQEVSSKHYFKVKLSYIGFFSQRK